MRKAPLLVVVVTGLALAATPAQGATPNRCKRPPGASVLVRSAYATLYVRELRRDSLNTRTTLWGCLRSSGKLRPLPGGSTSETSLAKVPSRFRLNGRFAGYVRQDTYRGIGSGEIVVADLRSGRIRRWHAATVSQTSAGTEGITGFVLTTRGHAAWSDRRLENDAWTATIRARDARGVRTLDRGPEAEVGHLSLVDANVARWISHGTVRAVVLR